VDFFLLSDDAVKHSTRRDVNEMLPSP